MPAELQANASLNALNAFGVNATAAWLAHVQCESDLAPVLADRRAPGFGTRLGLPRPGGRADGCRRVRIRLSGQRVQARIQGQPDRAVGHAGAAQALAARAGLHRTGPRAEGAIEPDAVGR